MVCERCDFAERSGSVDLHKGISGEFTIALLRFANGEKCLFFKNDSYLSSYLSKESIFSQNPKTTTIPFTKNSNFIFGEWFNE